MAPAARAAGAGRRRGSLGGAARAAAAGALHLLALALFLKGFLLTRLELPHVSRCDDIASGGGGGATTAASPPPPSSSGRAAAAFPPPACWAPPAYDRAVVIIIDALRYDFLAGPPAGGRRADHHGRMPRLRAALRDAVRGRRGHEPLRARLSLPRRTAALPRPLLHCARAPGSG